MSGPRLLFASILQTFEPVALLGLLIFLCFVAWVDGVYRRIPNYATYSITLAGFLWGAMCTYVPHPFIPGQSFMEAIAGSLACFSVMFVIYSYTNSGAGDVKLAAGIGSFLGVKGGLLTICYAHISAACFAGCLIIWLFGFGFAIRGLMRFLQIWIAPENPEIAAKATDLMSRGLPLAPFFLLGTVIHLFDLLRFFPAR